jgi:diguanylate cyclase (GGDEF)-like protein/PAS domain S-box-containing protein
MKNQNNIGLVFSLIILLLVVQGVLSLTYLDTIASQTDNLYQHPYAVSNAARNININLVSMHRYMKDVALAENEQKIKTASSLVDKHEQQVLKNFDLIFDRYLGKHSDIQSAYKAFIDWKVIRDEVVFLKTKGKNKQAADITRNKGAEHVAFLNQETQKLIDFADNKAKTFLSNAVEAKKNAFTVVIGLLITTVLASIFSSYYAVRRLNAAQIDMKSRMHLIDQNILMAKLDKKGVIVDISNHLCRYFGVSKNEMIGGQSGFFINDEKGTTQPANILKITSTGKIWEGEICRLSAEGRVQWIHSVVHPELDENYEVQGYTNIIHDVTDHKAVEELSITDTLTGLYNRRHFDNVIEKEIRISNRNKMTLTFAVIDLDYFKKYNDHYGHPAGDDVLIKVAQVFKQSMRRPNDYIFRLGGEEFGVIFSGLDIKQSFEFLEIIRNKIEKLNIEHCESDVSQFMTISLGAYLSSGPNIPDSNQLYIKADEALYVAKSQRNCVVVN